ncbi:MAG: DUF5317 family protein [Acutalibacteraceae bacterium]
MQPECLIQGAASASFLFAGSGIVMLLFFFLALLAGRLRGRRVGVVFCQKSLIPYFVLELCYIGVQVSAFCGYYGFVPYASWIKRLYFLVLLVPILVHRLYVPAISGAGAVAAGTLLNRVVMNANGGKMPVFATLSRWTGYFTPDFAAAGDTIHIVGDSSVKLAFLADYIDLGYCILSVGDLLVHSFTFIIIYAVVRAVCPLRSSGAPRSGSDADRDL